MTAAEQTHALEECARRIVGNDTAAAVEWVARRLRRGEFSGYRAARRWRMTDADIAAAIETLRPGPPRAPVAAVQPLADPATRADRLVAALDRPLISSMTRTSQRRLAR